MPSWPVISALKFRSPGFNTAGVDMPLSTFYINLMYVLHQIYVVHLHQLDLFLSLFHRMNRTIITGSPVTNVWLIQMNGLASLASRGNRGSGPEPVTQYKALATSLGT